MRNKQMPIKSNEGILLDVWGHDISLSLDEKYFSIFNIESGLQLYPTSSNLINSSSPVPSLSSQSVSAWNNKGELLVASSDDLLIFEPESCHVSTISLPIQKNQNCSRIITSLEWNNKSDRIVYTVLEDFPDTESSIFELSIIDRNGSHIASKLVSNLGSTVWLSNELILYLTYNNIEENQGKMRLWNYKTNKTTEFLPCDKYYYRFAYNPRLEQLVFTQANGIGETLFLLNMNTGITRELITLPYTIRNLQWSNYGTLFFWDEYNNCIFQLVNLDQSTPNTLDNKECSVIPFATGYLPTNCVRNNVLFFLAEPQEEPMQPIFTKDQADN
jgi:hypothetical protein